MKTTETPSVDCQDLSLLFSLVETHFSLHVLFLLLLFSMLDGAVLGYQRLVSDDLDGKV